MLNAQMNLESGIWNLEFFLFKFALILTKRQITKMETFKIHSPFDKQDFIRAMLVKWEIHWLKNRRQLINYSIASFIILSIGIVARTEEEPTNPFIFLGIGFAFATLLFFYFRILSKRRYSRQVQNVANKFDSIKMDCIYEFSDESIKYWDKEKTLDFKWTLFTNYSTYKNYLIIILNNSLIESYLFEKKESDLEEYNKVLEITKSKLKYKEIR